MKVVGISVIGNKGLNLICKSPKHEDILKIVSSALPDLSKILLDFIP